VSSTSPKTGTVERALVDTAGGGAAAEDAVAQLSRGGST
jgi:hypothetical protein